MSSVQQDSPRQFSCAVVIPTKSRPRLLIAAVLSALEAVRPVGGEVIVIDDNGRLRHRTAWPASTDSGATS